MLLLSLHGNAADTAMLLTVCSCDHPRTGGAAHCHVRAARLGSWLLTTGCTAAASAACTRPCGLLSTACSACMTRCALAIVALPLPTSRFAGQVCVIGESLSRLASTPEINGAYVASMLMLCDDV